MVTEYLDYIILVYVAAGVLTSALQRQYGRVNKDAVVVIKIVFYLIVVGLAFIDLKSFVLIMGMYTGDFLVVLYYFLFRKNHVMLPAITKELQQYQLDRVRLSVKLPKQNHQSDRAYLIDRTTDSYNRDYSSGIIEQVLDSRVWYAYNYKGDQLGRVIFYIRLQKLNPDTFNLSLECLNEAAISYYFFKNLCPSKIDMDSLDTDYSADCQLNDWVISHEPVPQVSYQCFNEKYKRTENYYHYLLTNKQMLTIEVIEDCYEEAEHVQQALASLAESVKNSWQVSYDDTKNDTKFHLPVNMEKLRKANDIQPFKALKLADKTLEDNELSRESYRKKLKQLAESPIDWFVFEQSPAYWPWFNRQLEQVCDQYNAIVDDYIHKNTTDIICRQEEMESSEDIDDDLTPDLEEKLNAY